MGLRFDSDDMTDAEFIRYVAGPWKDGTRPVDLSRLLVVLCRSIVILMDEKR
jgi:hypothetical protein